jgi:hypothetical protein
MTDLTDIKKQKHIVAFVIDSLNNDESWEYSDNNSDQVINKKIGIKIKCQLNQIVITAFNSLNQPAKIRVTESWFGDFSGLKKAINARMTKCIESIETEDNEAVIQRFVKIVTENSKK